MPVSTSQHEFHSSVPLAAGGDPVMDASFNPVLAEYPDFPLDAAPSPTPGGVPQYDGPEEGQGSLLNCCPIPAARCWRFVLNAPGTPFDQVPIWFQFDQIGNNPQVPVAPLPSEVLSGETSLQGAQPPPGSQGACSAGCGLRTVDGQWEGSAALDFGTGVPELGNPNPVWSVQVQVTWTSMAGGGGGFLDGGAYLLGRRAYTLCEQSSTPGNGWDLAQPIGDLTPYVPSEHVAGTAVCPIACQEVPDTGTGTGDTGTGTGGVGTGTGTGDPGTGTGTGDPGTGTGTGPGGGGTGTGTGPGGTGTGTGPGGGTGSGTGPGTGTGGSGTGDPGEPGNCGPNLIANGDAETGDTTGWTVGGDARAQQYGQLGYPDAAVVQSGNGGTYMFVGGESTPTSLTQTVDLTSYAATIDAGSTVAYAYADIGGYQDQDDNAKVTYQPLDAGGGALGSPLVLGPVLAADRANSTSLLPRYGTLTLPTGTRACRVVIDFTRYVGTDLDGYIDNLTLKLCQPT